MLLKTENKIRDAVKEWESHRNRMVRECAKFLTALLDDEDGMPSPLSDHESDPMTTDRNSEGAVAWGVRMIDGCSLWFVDTDKAAVEQEASISPDYVAIPLYEAPPASIPVAEVQAVERWETVRQFASSEDFDRWEAMAKDGHIPSDEGNEYADLRADELAKLIPRNPE